MIYNIVLGPREVRSRQTESHPTIIHHLWTRSSSTTPACSSSTVPACSSSTTPACSSSTIPACSSSTTIASSSSSTDMFINVDENADCSTLEDLSLHFRRIKPRAKNVDPLEDIRTIDVFDEKRVKMEYILFKIGQDFHCVDYASKLFSEINETVFNAFAEITNLDDIPKSFVLDTTFAEHGRLPTFDVDGCLSLEDDCLRDFVVLTIAYKYFILLNEHLQADFDCLIEKRKPVLEEYLRDKSVSIDVIGVKYYEWFVSLMCDYVQSNELNFLFGRLKHYQDSMTPHLTPFAAYGPPELFYKSAHRSGRFIEKKPQVELTLTRKVWSNPMEFNLICLQYQAQIEASQLEDIKQGMKKKFSYDGKPRIFHHINYARSSQLHLARHCFPTVFKGFHFDAKKILAEISRFNNGEDQLKVQVRKFQL